MKENCNLRVIGTLVIITVMTQSSLSLFSNASAGEIPGREIEIGPDIEIEGIDVWPGYPVVGRHTCKINVTLNNKGCLPADGFYVNCSLEIAYLNATSGIATVKESLPQKSCALDANGMRILTFVWDPPEEFARYLPYYDMIPGIRLWKG